MAIFLAIGASWPDAAAQIFREFQESALRGLKWYFIAIVSFALGFVLWLGFGRYRSVRLGGDEERPRFTYTSWFSMLFAAGMGIGLIFWSVAEPLSHYQSNPLVEADQTTEAAAVAMRLTFFHWGLSAWAVYSLVALGLAYFAFRHGRPLTPRAILYELIGRRADGIAGHAVDVATVFGAAFGIATSLGLGVQQIDGGISYLFDTGSSLTRQLTVLATVTLVATLSALSGIRRGVRVISDFNLALSAVILVFFLVYGPTRHLLDVFVQTTGSYLQALPTLSTWTDAYGHTGWQETWTLFYWGWWIAWSPFVGMFIARISRGRTIREFVMGVLLVPVLLTFAWLAITGGSALYLELFQGVDLLTALNSDPSRPLFETVAVLAPGTLGTVVTALRGLHLTGPTV